MKLKFIFLLLLMFITFSCELKQKKVTKETVNTLKKDTTIQIISSEIEDNSFSVDTLSSKETNEVDSVWAIKFDKIELTFRAEDIWTEASKFEITHKDSLSIEWGLGDDFENQLFTLRIMDSLIIGTEIYQSYQTSMSVTDDGAHLDLLNWLHYNSEWEKLEIENNYFKALSYTEEESIRFPKVSQSQILEEVIKASGSEDNKFTREFKNYESEGTGSPCMVSINKVSLKIILLMDSGKYEEKIITFNFPMGC